MTKTQTPADRLAQIYNALRAINDQARRAQLEAEAEQLRQQLN
jgi:propanediol dehydratase small subunit